MGTKKICVDEWIVHLEQGMYSDARSRVRVGEGYSEEFEVKVGDHQGSLTHCILEDFSTVICWTSPFSV